MANAIFFSPRRVGDDMPQAAITVVALILFVALAAGVLRFIEGVSLMILNRGSRGQHAGGGLNTVFTQLNHGWNAEPNGPDPQAVVEGDSVVLSFQANPFKFESFEEGQIIRLMFRNVWRYGFSNLNDEGWYMGQCRFSQLAPVWGDFYEVAGDLKEPECKVRWHYLSDEPTVKTTRYLFYFRDQTFECDASSWERIA